MRVSVCVLGEVDDAFNQNLFFWLDSGCGSAALPEKPPLLVSLSPSLPALSLQQQKTLSKYEILSLCLNELPSAHVAVFYAVRV